VAILRNPTHARQDEIGREPRGASHPDASARGRELLHMTVPEPDVVCARLDELVELWREDPYGSVDMKRRGMDSIGLTIYGLAAHAHALAAAVRVLDKAGGEPTMVPLVRQILECAVTAAWVEKYGQRAVLAVVHDDARGRVNTFKQFVESGTPDDGSVAEWQAALDLLDPDRSRSSEHFEQRCAEIEGLGGTYAMYRALSGISHASGMVSEMYLRQVDQPTKDQPGVVLARGPEEWARDAVLGTALTYLLLAAAAWDRVDGQHRSRSRLKQIASEIGVRLAWQESAVGLRRQHEWERARRRRRSPQSSGSPGSRQVVASTGGASADPRDRRAVGPSD